MTLPLASPTLSERPYGGIDHEARVSERRERFIAAGIRVIGSAGYRAATVRVLCAEAGLSNRYFYESFDSTEALLMAVYRRLMGDCQAAILTAMQQAPRQVEAITAAGVRVFFEHARDPLFARATLLEVMGVSAAVDAMYQENIRVFGRMIMGGARAVLVDDDLPEEEADMLGLSLVGALAYAAMHWMQGGYRLSVDQMVSNAVRIIGGTALGIQQSRGK
ncbi:TetR family transcriptional regulator [Fluviicoccus keumensis]|uniref:TetR family transcriptional regulator n=1 Tax=Fluviicoccus keumensis TaxID=1435465 RepID=A0A4Q7YNZ2_9GAMM|nr:TetR/AcrR family transcriptional regulator [Fluviicoccus keumensis]RZU38561.1 TetR family transcriptional regulator [Fluviicoccus keumensis]